MPTQTCNWAVPGFHLSVEDAMGLRALLEILREGDLEAVFDTAYADPEADEVAWEQAKTMLFDPEGLLARLQGRGF